MSLTFYFLNWILSLFYALGQTSNLFSFPTICVYWGIFLCSLTLFFLLICILHTVTLHYSSFCILFDFVIDFFVSLSCILIFMLFWPEIECSLLACVQLFVLLRKYSVLNEKMLIFLNWRLLIVFVFWWRRLLMQTLWLRSFVRFHLSFSLSFALKVEY